MSLVHHPADIVRDSSSPLLAKHPDWPRVPLGSVATILNGAAFKSKLFSPDHGVPLIRIRDIAGSETSMRYPGEYDKRYLVQPDQLLVGMDGDFKLARWRGAVALLNQRVCRIAPDPARLHLDFLTYVLPGYLQAIHAVTSSTTVKHLSSRDIAQIPIPLPTIVEQRLIATHLSKLADHGASVGAHLQIARGLAARLRSAVLFAACSGRLTEEWREARPGLIGPSLKPDELRAESSRGGRAGVQPPRTEAMSDPPPGWAIARVGEVADVMLGGTPPREHPVYWKGDVPWISSGEVANCRIATTRERITDEGLANSNAKLYPAGTVLIAMIGEGKTRGQSAILDIEASTNQNAAGILANREFLDPEFVWRWAQAEYEATRAVGRGGNQPALNGQKVRELIIPVPALAEQAEIVRRVDALLGRADEPTRAIDRAAEALERSSKAVLARAFRGEPSSRGASEVGVAG